MDQTVSTWMSNITDVHHVRWWNRQTRLVPGIQHGKRRSKHWWTYRHEERNICKFGHWTIGHEDIMDKNVLTWFISHTQHVRNEIVKRGKYNGHGNWCPEHHRTYRHGGRKHLLTWAMNYWSWRFGLKRIDLVDTTQRIRYHLEWS